MHLKATNKNFYSLCGALALTEPKLNEIEIEAKATTMLLFKPTSAYQLIVEYDRAIALKAKMRKTQKVNGVVKDSDLNLTRDMYDRYSGENARALSYLIRYGLAIEIRPGLYKLT